MRRCCFQIKIFIPNIFPEEDGRQLTLARERGVSDGNAGVGVSRRERRVSSSKAGEFLGIWYVVEYYASSEEALAYKCMKGELSVSSENDEVTTQWEMPVLCRCSPLA
ncbi:uncharacterized protein LOC122511550 [Leptopilina heterotoma]|uniref:uncharacterized protein LOC122511550 n=1 Tax=Leptopilina heterotoma TaxID=63436 RepID=UPI001CA89877|nr:uncharacterized protein LOC122511550 [Leptopilina heterotoma]